MTVTNRWNRIIYKFWSPVYDLLFDRLLFAAGRRRTFELLQVRDMERVLLMGIGTGADLTYLPQEIQAVSVDLSPEMLLKAKKKLSGTGSRFLVQALFWTLDNGDQPGPLKTVRRTLTNASASAG